MESFGDLQHPDLLNYVTQTDIDELFRLNESSINFDGK